MTEDNELTIALKSLGAKMCSPLQCRVTTELMPSLHALWRQRMRWERGALENIGAYGFTRGTTTYWLQQLGIGYGTIALKIVTCCSSASSCSPRGACISSRSGR